MDTKNSLAVSRAGSVPFAIRKQVFDLSSTGIPSSRALALEVSVPVKALYVRDASDSAAYLYLVPNTPDLFQDEMKLQKKDSLVFDTPLSKFYVYTDAQAGKTLTLEMYVGIEFRPGSFLISSLSSLDGASITSDANLNVGVTAAVLVPADSNRSKTTIYNATGGTIYLGGSGMTLPGGANVGIPLNAGDTFFWRNTTALYAIAAVATTGLVYSYTEK